jgi:hypothetical protein
MHDVAQCIPGVRLLTGASNHEAGGRSGAVQQEEDLHPAGVASGGAPLRDCLPEGDCFGSPVLPEIPQLLNEDKGRFLEKVASALAPVVMPFGSPSATIGTNMQQEHQGWEAQEDFELRPTSTPKLGSLIAQQTAVGLEQAPPEQISPLPSQAVVALDEASPLMRALPADATVVKRQPLASQQPFTIPSLSNSFNVSGGLKHGEKQAEKDPGMLKGPALPSCFRMDDSTPTKSPSDSAPDYFPSPEMTQKVSFLPTALNQGVEPVHLGLKNRVERYVANKSFCMSDQSLLAANHFGATWTSGHSGLCMFLFMREPFEPLSVLVQDAERPLFQGQAGRKPFAAPQVRSFSRGSGLLLPTTDIHQPEVHSQSLHWRTSFSGCILHAFRRSRKGCRQFWISL